MVASANASWFLEAFFERRIAGYEGCWMGSAVVVSYLRVSRGARTLGSWNLHKRYEYRGSRCHQRLVHAKVLQLMRMTGSNGFCCDSFVRSIVCSLLRRRLNSVRLQVLRLARIY